MYILDYDYVDARTDEILGVYEHMAFFVSICDGAFFSNSFWQQFHRHLHHHLFLLHTT